MGKRKKISDAERLRRDKLRKRMKRDDPVVRSQEQVADTAARRSARQDPERRSQEQQVDTAARRSARQDPERRVQEQQVDTAARRSARQDPVRRRQEQKENTAAHRSARQDPVRRRQEREENTAAHRSARQDPVRRRQEQEENTAAHRTARQDPVRRTQEQEENTAAHRTARQDPVRRTQEQEANTAAHRSARRDPTRRSQEQQENTAARRNARQDPVRRSQEQQADTSRRSEVRKTPSKRLRDQNATRASKVRKTILTSGLNFQIESFKKKIRDSPEFVCSCCGGLFYPDRTHVVTEGILRNKGLREEQIKDLLYVNQQTHRLCDTCYRTATTKKQVHKLCLANGLDFPEVPKIVKELSPLEERLVSPYLPFMQIRPAGVEQQSKLKGNVINVENDFDVCASVLPRNMTETSTVHVQLLRKLQYTTPVYKEIIRPYNVHKAMEYLIETDGYIAKEITLSDHWKEKLPNETVEFCPNNDEEERRRPEEDNEDSEDDNEEILARVPPTETLIHDVESETMGYRIAPGEGKRPVPFMQDIEIEEITFPTIFGGKKRILRKLPRGQRLTTTDILKSKLRNRNRISVKNPTYLLYIFKKSFNQKVRDAIRICMRKQRPGSKITAGSILTPGFLDNMIQIDNGYVVFQGVRSTPAYWKSKQKKVVSMLRQLGPCSFFITLSAAETKSPELLKSLCKIVHGKDVSEEDAMNLSNPEKYELIRSDPVTCMRHFDHKYKAFQNLLLAPKPPKEGVFTPYRVSDYFSRVEFQKRGSPHIHGLYWIPDAPVYKEDDPVSTDAVTTFIDKFITTEREGDDDISDLIGYQNHKHAITCHRWHGTERKCRFRFPQPPLPRTMILTPLEKDLPMVERKTIQDNFDKIVKDLEEKTNKYVVDIPFDEYIQSLGLDMDTYITAIRSSINRATVFLRRKTNAAYINGYNHTILRTWRANMDIQFVLDMFACAKYCASYVSKAEGGISKLLQACLQDIKRGNKSVKENLLQFGTTLINGSETCSQEAVGFTMSLHNTFCTRDDIYINTARPDERISFLRSETDLKDLGEESEDIYEKGLLDHYVKRPKELESICLAEFASNYNFQRSKQRKTAKKDSEDTSSDDSEHEEEEQPNELKEGTFTTEDGSMMIRQREVRKVIRYRHYSKAKEESEYWREQLMLYVPWRNEEAELIDIDTKSKAAALIDLIVANSKYYHYNRLIDEEDIQNDIAEANNIEVEDVEREELDRIIPEEEEEEYAREFITETSTTPAVQRFLPPSFLSDDNFFNMMAILNDKQRRFVLDCLHRLKVSKEPFHAFLHGGAGVGKSHTITAIVQCFLRFWSSFPTQDPDCPPVLVASFTGKASFNVGGMTLSSAFRLLPQQSKGSAGSLDDGAANSLRSKLRNLKLLIVDEISMVGVRMFYDVNKRLQQIMCNMRPFGGISVIVVGHLRQLKPICDSWVFSAPKHLKAGQLGNLWDLFKIYELDQIMRQQGEFLFCKALNNMSEGVMDEGDIALIKARTINVNQQPPEDAIWLFRTNAECEAFNETIHNKLQGDSFLSIARDHVEGSNNNKSLEEKMINHAKTLTINECDGLRYMVPLKVGAVYLISTNIDVSDGLYNGADGYLMRIDYGTVGGNLRIPYRIWMKFKTAAVGNQLRSRTKDYQVRNGIPLEWVPIERLTKNLSKVKYMGASLIRSQFPLLAANAMTIPKAQGSTLENVVVGLSAERQTERADLYVACSRTTSLSGLFIKGTFKPPKKPAHNDAVTVELTRLRGCPLGLSFPFLQDLPSGEHKLYFHNIQSVVQHGRQLFADNCAKSADIITLVETKIKDTSHFETGDFKIVAKGLAKKTGNSWNSEGGLILSKNGAKHLETMVQREADDKHLTLMICVEFDTVVVTFYKHPSYTRGGCLTLLEKVLQKYSGVPCIFVGDSNCNLNAPEGQPLIQLFEKYNLESKLPFCSPSTNLGTTIDCCFSNVSNLYAWYYESYYSYHKPICMKWKL